MKSFTLLTALFCLLGLSACSTTIKKPKGTCKGYTSARLIEHNPDADITDDPVERAKEKSIHKRIQKAIKTEFIQHGMSYGKKEAQLKVAYLVMIQNNAITFYYNDFFSRGRDADALAEYAHLKGVTQSKRDEFFERVIIVVDIIDTQTNKLIYRNYYANDIVDVPSEAVRTKRINAAIKSTLKDFFVK